MKRFAWILVAVAGCGRSHFDALATADARSVPPDVLPPCTAYGPFSPPQLVENVNAFGAGFDDWTPMITADDLGLYFYSFRVSLPGGSDLWHASRPTPTDPFAPPEEITELSTPQADWSPHVTADELMMLFTSDRPGGAGGFDIYQATRPDKTSAWGTPSPVASASVALPVNSGGSEEAVWVSGDGLRIVFDSGRNASLELLSAERPDLVSPFGAVQLLTDLNDVAADDDAPGLSSDELEIFFMSNRAGGMGRYDIWHATRPARTQPFSAPQPVTELDSPGDDYGPSLSADGRRLYYTYNAVSSGGGDANIYVATRSCQ